MSGYNKKGLSRRQFIGAVLAGGTTAGCATINLWGAEASGEQKKANSDGQENGRKRVLRFAHVTDVHITADRRASEGYAACLQHLHEQQDRPELILMGGDAIMDALKADEAQTRDRWRLYREVMERHCRIP
ncbi:MAG: twin-arginine translocation signal domain-containing protein, partial [Sedimentisphaerales bacterium]|nr:twin-arginine translocation signal domain-containing protein [Sedimentisphaerales bacterium]